jgi:hypothetical protein
LCAVFVKKWILLNVIIIIFFCLIINHIDIYFEFWFRLCLCVTINTRHTTCFYFVVVVCFKLKEKKIYLSWKKLSLEWRKAPFNYFIITWYFFLIFTNITFLNDHKLLNFIFLIIKPATTLYHVLMLQRVNNRSSWCYCWATATTPERKKKKMIHVDHKTENRYAIINLWENESVQREIKKNNELNWRRKRACFQFSMDDK